MFYVPLCISSGCCGPSLVIARHALPCLFLMDNRMTWSQMRKMTATQLQWILLKSFCNWCVFLLPITVGLSQTVVVIQEHLKTPLQIQLPSTQPLTKPVIFWIVCCSIVHTPIAHTHTNK